MGDTHQHLAALRTQKPDLATLSSALQSTVHRLCELEHELVAMRELTAFLADALKNHVLHAQRMRLQIRDANGNESWALGQPGKGLRD